jgi:hypothetical protein
MPYARFSARRSVISLFGGASIGESSSHFSGKGMVWLADITDFNARYSFDAK